MVERRLLTIAYAFPPSTAPEALLISKRLVNLTGWRADVVTAAERKGDTRDEDLLSYVAPHVRTITRVAPRWTLPWDRLRTLSCVPDPYLYWTFATLRAVRALGPDNFDAMLSWSQWHSAHVAALWLKRRYPTLPWVAHFSDPWIGNPYITGTPMTGRVNAFWERKVIKHADRVTFTTPETVNLVMAKYPAAWLRKVAVIPHGFEPVFLSGEEPSSTADRRLVCRYIGNFYGIRTPEPLFVALRGALAQRPALADQIIVELIGASQTPLENFPSYAVLPAGLVVQRSPVNYRESLRLMETADLLIVVDAPGESSVFLPSKLVDYLGAGRPIVAFTPPGASARVMAESGFPTADPEDGGAVVAALLRGLALTTQGTHLSPQRDRYTAQATSATLAEVLGEIA
jgi:hypothetical protein